MAAAAVALWCDALMAAALAFFSDTRLAMRARVGGGRGVSYWIGRKMMVRREAEKEGKRGERDWGEDMEVIRTRTRSFAPSGVLSCGA